MGSVPMLGQRPAVLENDPDADPGECGEGSDANEGKQEKLPAPGAYEFHEVHHSGVVKKWRLLIGCSAVRPSRMDPAASRHAGRSGPAPVCATA